MSVKSQLIYISISLFFAFIIFNNFIPLSKFSFELNKKEKTPFSTGVIYHDFNNDGLDEKFIFLKNDYKEQKKYDSEFTRYSVQIKNFNGDKFLSDEINSLNHFDEKTSFIEDLNNDNSDELIFISNNDSTLFLNIYDIRTQKFIVKDFMFYQREKNKDLVWMVNYWVLIKDINNDGVSEIYISSSTGGKAIYPRDMFLIDITKPKVLRTFETKCGISHPFFCDVNNDGVHEIVGYSGAPGNSDKSGYHDWTTRLWVFNLDLSLYNEPKTKGYFPDGILLEKINIDGKVHILKAFINNSRSAGPTTFSILDQNQNEIRTIEYPEKSIIDIFVLKEVLGDQKIILAFKNGEYKVLDHKLNTVSENHFPLEYSYILDTISDKDEKYLLVQNSRFVYICDAELKLKADLKLPEKTYLASLYRNKITDQNYLLVEGQNDHYHYKIAVNQIYSLRYALFLIIVFLVYFAQFLLIQAYKKIYYFSFLYVKLIKENKDVIILADSTGKIVKQNNSSKNFISQFLLQNQTEIEISSIPELSRELKKCVNTGEKISNLLRIPNSTITYQLEVNRLKKFLIDKNIYMIKISENLKNQESIIWAKSIQKISHDIKTPLSSIRLNLKMIELKASKENVDFHLEEIKVINKEMQRIQNLTQNFLKFVNLEKPKIQQIDLKKIIEKSKNNFTSFFENGLSIQIQICDECKHIWADPYQFEELINIFIENAIDAIEADGMIEITVTFAQELHDVNQSYLLIEISDNGCGMSSEHSRNIFDPYFTTKEKGTGLGLAIAKKIVEDHKGTIEIYSREKIGTTFKIKLPKEF